MDRIIIIGGGISGLSLAYFLQRQRPSLDIIVLEAEKRLGGKIWTDRADGFLCESGVNGFLDNRANTLELAKDLELSPLKSSDSARKRYIFSGGKLHLLPESPPAFFKSGLLSLIGKLRIIYEIFAPRGGEEDESLADFARRRLGREAYEKLIDPMASGIYAGDPEMLSLASCFPKIHKIEMEYGSLIRAMIKLQLNAKKEGKSAPGAGPGGALTSFYNGMEELINALKMSVGAKIMPESRVVSLDMKGSCYSINLAGGSFLETDAVAVATPACEAALILKNLDTTLSETLGTIPYPSVSVVCIGYRQEKVQANLDGFGFLIPFGERRKMLGTLWDSSIFPNRAPRGHILLRSMVGGARASDMAMLDKERLVAVATSELRDIMGIKADPDFVRIYVHERAIPQYTVGHKGRLKIIDDLLLKYKKMYITGNAYGGIGVNDCIENSQRLADGILEDIKI